jgi:hypothetical protein
MVQIVPIVQAVQTVSTPSVILPNSRGGGQRWGLERSEAIERFERLEQARAN